MHFFARNRRKLSITPLAANSEARQRPLAVAREPSSLNQVRPAQVKSGPYEASPKLFARIKLRELADASYHWTTCMFIITLVCSQLLGAVWDSTKTTNHLFYGRSPLLGPSQIVGTNDVPFPDRVIVCVRNGQDYEPKLVSSLLAAPGRTAMLEDSTGTAMHGYRLRQRRVGSIDDSLDSGVLDVYESSCALIADTIDNIFASCLALGYENLTRDSLRVVDDWDSKNVYVLPNTLPVLIMPYWDNAAYSRHAIPTWGGDACIFRLEDAFTMVEGSTAIASFRGVNQSVRHERTIEWLNRPGGYWKNGWYEDLEGIRWYSDVKSSAPGAPYNMMHRLFDMRTGKEVDCSTSDDCEAAAHIDWWGDKFSSSDKGNNITSIYIANATEFGVFVYESYEQHIVRSVFDWETLVSSLSVAFVLTRWVVSLVSLHLGAYRGKSLWFSGGIGCISGAESFGILPFASMPRLKMTLAAFWTVGCRFEGQQIGLAAAWFAIYPAIVNFMLIYFSLLNLAAKALRRRVSDALFAPTILLLCMLHYFRLELAASGWLKGIDGRIATVVFSDEVNSAQLSDYFTTDIAWRMNGRVPLIFGLKLAILGVNLLPLLLARPFPRSTRCTELGLHGVEKALALRARYVGGLGCSLTYMVAEVDTKKNCLGSTLFTDKIMSKPSEKSLNYDGDCHSVVFGPIKTNVEVTPILNYNTRIPSIATDTSNAIDATNPSHHNTSHQEVALVNSYELIRLGYVVFGDKYLITFDEWDLLSSMGLFRSFCHFWNHRVLVWTLRPAVADGDAEVAGGRALQCTEPQMWRLDDPRLQRVRWWQVSACSIQC